MHRLIALELINRRGPLVSSEMRFLRHEMNLSRQSLGHELGVEIAFITQWERNDRRLPRDADVNLRILYATNRLTDRDTTLSVHLLADDDYPPSPVPMVFTWADSGWRLSHPAARP
ncbi:helix-turn-helix domain-containing protein [Sodalis sp. C49]|uniref:helix-turn-helix domain-containing protein n=1 Tax=Sodalis sp. C49 TaxID=3228929 RepID=UPI003965B5E7